MRPVRSFWILFVAVFLAFIALFPSHSGGADATAAESAPPRRVWRDDVLGSRIQSYPARGDELLAPQDVVEGPGGNVYVLDLGDQTVKQFSPAGQMVRRFGRGRGGGPGEVANATDFDVTPDGGVWMLDPGQGRIQVFRPDGTPERVIRIATPASRLALHRDGSYTLLGLSEWLLYRYTSRDSLARGFGQVLPEQRLQTLALQGEIAATGDGGLVYGPLRAGFLARFDRGGRMVYHRPTIEPRPYPQIEVLPNGGRMIARRFRDALSTRAVSVSGEEAWVLAPVAGRGSTGWAVDVYAVSDGAYRYSVRLREEDAASIYVTPRHLYVVGETSVTRWQRER